MLNLAPISKPVAAIRKLIKYLINNKNKQKGLSYIRTGNSRKNGHNRPMRNKDFPVKLIDVLEENKVKMNKKLEI